MMDGSRRGDVVKAGERDAMASSLSAQKSVGLDVGSPTGLLQPAQRHVPTHTNSLGMYARPP